MIDREAELKELYRRLYELDAKFEKAKGKRMILAILGFAVFYFLVLYILNDPTGIEIIFDVLLAIVIAGFHFWINVTIFSQLVQLGREESAILENIRKRIRDLE